MYKYFIAGGEIYKVSLKRQLGNYFYLCEQRLETNGNWTTPIQLGISGKGMTLEKACKRVYGFPFYYDSLKEAKRGLVA